MFEAKIVVTARKTNKRDFMLDRICQAYGVRRQDDVITIERATEFDCERAATKVCDQLDLAAIRWEAPGGD